MDFIIEGLDPQIFAGIFDEHPDILRQRGIIAFEANDDDYPCRISLEHAAQGDQLLLINFEHQQARSPYRSSHAIYVARSSRRKGVFENTLPPIMASRLLSIRAFDDHGLMISAQVVDGAEAAPQINQMLDGPDVAYLHVHFAARGCFAGVARRCTSHAHLSCYNRSH